MTKTSALFRDHLDKRACFAAAWPPAHWPALHTAQAPTHIMSYNCIYNQGVTDLCTDRSKTRFSKANFKHTYKTTNIIPHPWTLGVCFLYIHLEPVEESVVISIALSQHAVYCTKTVLSPFEQWWIYDSKVIEIFWIFLFSQPQTSLRASPTTSSSPTCSSTRTRQWVSLWCVCVYVLVCVWVCHCSTILEGTRNSKSSKQR